MRRTQYCFWSMILSIALWSALVGEAWALRPKSPSSEPARPPKEGVVLKVEENKKSFIVDLGQSQGVVQDTRIQLYRRVTLRHPISKKLMADRFHIGIGVVKQASRLMSIVEVEGALAYPLKIGDFASPGAPPPPRVKIVKVIQKVKVNVPCQKDDRRANCVDAEQQMLQRTWRNLKGKTLRQRLNMWRSQMRVLQKPENVKLVSLHVRWLSGLERKMQDPTPYQADMIFRHRGPSWVYRGEQVSIVASAVFRRKPAAVICYYRAKGELLYRKLKMHQINKYYYAIDLPRRAVERAGHFDYFIESVAETGVRRKAFASDRRPRRVSVLRLPGVPTRKRGRSFASTSLEYVDFFATSLGKDSYLRFETDYRYLVEFGKLYAVKMGFGIFEGQSAPVDVLDANPNAEVLPQAYSYGFLEAEMRFHPYFASMLRAILGSVRQSGVLNDPGALIGFEARLRFGRLLGTNLEIAGMLTSDIGGEGEIKVTISEIPRFPMSGSVVVTNLPLGRDLGVRLIYQIGWRPVSWFSLDARLGWNVRNVNHSGPSAGLGMSFRW